MWGRGGDPRVKRGGGVKRGRKTGEKGENPQHFPILKAKRGGNGYGRGGNREYKIQSTRLTCSHPHPPPPPPLLVWQFRVIQNYYSTKKNCNLHYRHDATIRVNAVCPITFQGGVAPTNFEGSIDVDVSKSFQVKLSPPQRLLQWRNCEKTTKRVNLGKVTKSGPRGGPSQGPPRAFVSLLPSSRALYFLFLSLPERRKRSKETSVQKLPVGTRVKYFYLSITPWVFDITVIAPTDPPFTYGGHMLLQFLSCQCHVTVFVRTGNNFERAGC